MQTNKGGGSYDRCSYSKNSGTNRGANRNRHPVSERGTKGIPSCKKSLRRWKPVKVKAKYEIDLPDDLHGEDIEAILKDNGESIGAELVEWG